MFHHALLQMEEQPSFHNTGNNHVWRLKYIYTSSTINNQSSCLDQAEDAVYKKKEH